MADTLVARLTGQATAENVGCRGRDPSCRSAALLDPNDSTPAEISKTNDEGLQGHFPSSTYCLLILDRRHRLYCMCTANRLHSCFRESEMPDFAFADQFLHSTGYIFDWHFWINTMLIEQIDVMRLESLERCFGNFLDVLRPASTPGQ